MSYLWKRDRDIQIISKQWCFENSKSYKEFMESLALLPPMNFWVFDGYSLRTGSLSKLKGFKFDI